MKMLLSFTCVENRRRERERDGDENSSYISWCIFCECGLKIKRQEKGIETARDRETEREREINEYYNRNELI